MKFIFYQHFGDINNFGKIILEPYLTYLYYVFYHSCFIFFRTSRETNKKVSKLILHTVICEQWSITLLCKEAFMKMRISFKSLTSLQKDCMYMPESLFAPQDKHI